MIYIRLLSVNKTNCDDLCLEFLYEILNWHYLCAFLTSGNSIQLRRNFARSRIWKKRRILVGAGLRLNPNFYYYYYYWPWCVGGPLAYCCCTAESWDLSVKLSASVADSRWVCVVSEMFAFLNSAICSRTRRQLKITVFHLNCSHTF